MSKTLLILLSIIFSISCSTLKKESIHSTTSRSTASDTTSANFSSCKEYLFSNGAMTEVQSLKIEHLSSGSSLVSQHLQCPYLLVENWEGKGTVERFYNLEMDNGIECSYNRVTTAGARSNISHISNLNCYLLSDIYRSGKCCKSINFS